MSNSTIDQLLKIATPAPSAREAIRSDRKDGGDVFREHLDRAADATSPKTSAVEKENKSASLTEEQPLDTQTSQDETPTTEQDETASSTETAETAPDTPEERPSEEETNDEVTLSTAAAVAQQAEVVVIEPEVVAEAVVVSTSAENQQQSEGQQAHTNTNANTDDTADETATPINGPIEVETALLNTPEDGAASNNEEPTDETTQQNNTSIAKETSDQVVQHVAVTTVGEDEAKKTQAPTSALASAKTTSPIDEQQQSTEALEALPGSDTVDNAPKAGTKVPETTVFNPPTPGTEVELLEAGTHNGTEVIADTSTNSPATSSSSENLTAVDRTLPTALSGKSSASAQTVETSNGDTPTVDRARFIRRVGGAIRSAQLRGRPIQLQLSPPELGTLKIELTVVKSVMTAKLEVESVAARAVILDNLPALRERLADQEIRIDKFDVDVGQDDQQPADFSENKERQDQRTREQANSLPLRASTAEPATTTVTPSLPASTTSGLDIRI